MVQTSSQSTVNKIEMRLRGKGRGSIVFQQDYADCGTPSAVKSTFHRMYTDGMLVRLAHGIYYYPKEDKEYGLGITMLLLTPTSARLHLQKSHSR